jgi:thiosulfate/3-mercaptopyruvate sulfurtransferase
VKNSGVTFPLVSTIDLAESLSGAEPPVVLDVRWRLGGPPGREDYVRGHLPGAVFLDLDAELAAPPGPAGRHPLPEAADLERVLRAAGVREGGTVVAYDDGNGSIAARLWWLLRWAGHDRVQVLDGGYAAWSAEGRPATTEVPTPEPGDVTVRPGHMPVVDADGAAALARAGVLLDARAPERYRGDVEPIDPRAGHVPGARNAPFAAHTDADGRWRTPAELAEHFAKVGVGEGRVRVGEGIAGVGEDTKVGVAEDAEVRGGEEKEGVDRKVESEVGAYCGSGVTATSVVLALEVAGITSAEVPAALYAGSWSNWSADPSRPVSTGDAPD